MLQPISTIFLGRKRRIIGKKIRLAFDVINYDFKVDKKGPGTNPWSLEQGQTSRWNPPWWMALCLQLFSINRPPYSNHLKIGRHSKHGRRPWKSPETWPPLRNQDPTFVVLCGAWLTNVLIIKKNKNRNGYPAITNKFPIKNRAIKWPGVSSYHQ